MIGVKEVLGGYWMIEVKSRDEAIEWASRCPAADNEIIEIRQVQEMSDFPADAQGAAAGFTEMQATAPAKSMTHGSTRTVQADELGRKVVHARDI